jgi:hypothetical protein
VKSNEELVSEHKKVAATRRSPEWPSWSKALAAIEDELLRREVKRIGASNHTSWNRARATVAEWTGVSTYSIEMRRRVFLKKLDEAFIAEIWQKIDDGLDFESVKSLMGDKKRNEKRVKKTEAAESRSPFWKAVRRLSSGYVRTLLIGVPDEDVEESLRAFEVDLEVLFDHHRAKWGRLVRTLSVSRSKLREALRTLHMDLPKRGQPLSSLITQAGKQKRILARAYHPDMHGGSDVTRPMYQAVIEAYATVEQYVRENEPERPRLRVVDGGKND